MSEKNKAGAAKQSLITRPGFLNAMGSLAAIAAGLLCGFLVLLISNPSQAVPGLMMILRGGFTSWKSLGDTLHQSMPIIVTGLSVGFAFKTGLFNIGATGQFTVGAFAALYVGYNCTFLGPFTWIAALLAATLAGAFWGLIPGLFKAYLNVSEVISSIMMNYIGLHLVNLLVKSSNIYDQRQNLAYAPPESATVPSFGLDKIFYNKTGDYITTSTVHGGIIIAVLVAIAMYLILNRTTFGYELKACGYNRFASKYAGINEKRNIVLSMVIAGALSGLGGGLFYLSGSSGRRYKVIDVLLGEGYNGIPVALLGLSNPIAIIFAGFFIGHITVGGNNLQILGYVPEIISIITSVIIYFSAFSLLFKHAIISLSKRGSKSKGQAIQEAVAQSVGIEDPDQNEGGEAND